MEYVDIFDENRNLVKANVPRDEYKSGNYWLLAAHLWVIDSQNRLLAQRRSPQKKGSPNAWDITAAGHIMSGEDPRDAIVREAAEELGLELTPAELEIAGEFVHTDHRYFITSFFVRKDVAIESLVLQPEEVSEMRWFSIDELRENLASEQWDFVRRQEEISAIIEKFG